MSKRVFTKIARGDITIVEEFEEEVTGIYSWLVQEDIEVVGVNMCLRSSVPSENDGFASCTVELSQTAEYAQPGAIAAVCAGEGWNTTPAGISLANGNLALNFPVGLAIPVKEEGHLYVNAMTKGKSAGASMFNFEVLIYYTKKGSR